MFCREFEQNGYLYLYKELTTEKQNAFEAHLKTCAFCQSELREAQATLNQIDTLPLIQPAAQVSHTILNEADKAKIKPSVFRVIIETIASLAFKRKYYLAVPVITSLIIFSLIGNPFHPQQTSDEDEFLLKWEDHMFSEVLALDEEIDKFSSFISCEKIMIDSDLDDASFSILDDDLYDVREALDDINAAMTGI